MDPEQFADPAAAYRGVTLWMLNDRLEREFPGGHLLPLEIGAFHGAQKRRNLACGPQVSTIVYIRDG